MHDALEIGIRELGHTTMSCYFQLLYWIALSPINLYLSYLYETVCGLQIVQLFSLLGCPVSLGN